MNILDIINQIIGPNVIASSIHFAVPLILASLGGTISERSGVVNIAMEGMMLVGAFFGAWISAVLAGSLPDTVVLVIACLAAMAAGALISLIHAALSISFRANQIISGMSINLIAIGVTSLLLLTAFPNGNFPARYPYMPAIKIPAWEHVPILSAIDHASWTWFVPIALLMVVVVHVVLFRTKIGLRIRSVGENPVAAATLGIDVIKIRYACVMMSGVLSGLGGAWFTLESSSGFVNNVTSGQGYIALAAMIFGKWTPFGAFGASLLFGWGKQMTLVLPNIPHITNIIPADAISLIGALPYVLTIIAVAGFVGRSTPPAADGIPYEVKA